jgi:hypothetical protein
MAIEREDIHTIKYFDYGEAFYGSYKGMRYRVALEPLDFILYKSKEDKEKYNIRAYAWKEPFSFNEVNTDEEKKRIASLTCEDFEFTEEGIVKAVEWLNIKHEELA